MRITRSEEDYIISEMTRRVKEVVAFNARRKLGQLFTGANTIERLLTGDRMLTIHYDIDISCGDIQQILMRSRGEE